MFSRASKVKPLSYYLEQMRAPEDQSRGAMAVLGEFRMLKAKGLPIDIKRLN